MADTFYAWTNIHIPDRNDPGNPIKRKTVTPGEEVTPESLRMSQEDFDELVNIKAIRRTEHPDMGTFQGSPVEFRKAQIARMAATEDYFDEDPDRVGTSELPEVNPETGLPFTEEEKQAAALASLSNRQ